MEGSHFRLIDVIIITINRETSISCHLFQLCILLILLMKVHDLEKNISVQFAMKLVTLLGFYNIQEVN